MPSNITPATATLISSLPYSETGIDASSVGTGSFSPSCGPGAFHSLWWKVVVGASQEMFGFTATGGGNYSPVISIWTGAVGSPSMMICACATARSVAPTNFAALNFIGEPSTTYYIQVTATTASALDTTLAFAGVEPYEEDAPAGSLLINSDFTHFCALAFSTTGTPLANFPLPASRWSAWAGQRIAIPESNTDTGMSGGFHIYDNQLDLVLTNTTIVPVAASTYGVVSTDYVNTFYVAEIGPSANAILKTISTGGVVGGTTWTLPSTSQGMRALGISRDETIAYYSVEAGANLSAIFRYNLTTSSAMSNLRDHVAGQIASDDILVTTSGDVLFAVRVTSVSTVINVYRYDSAGSLQSTFVAASALGTPAPRLVLDNTGTGYWLMTFVKNQTTRADDSRLQHVDISTNTQTSVFLIEQAAGCAWKSVDPFGPPASCPIMVLPSAILNTVIEDVEYPESELPSGDVMLAWQELATNDHT